MQIPQWILLLLFLLPAMCDGQQRPAKDNWGFHAGAWLLWNTVHGDRYMPTQPSLPGIPLRDVDMTPWRSFARNSFSPAAGGIVERRLYKSFWIMGGLEFSQRKWMYVFDKDTLSMYPPVSPIPDGLYYRRIINYRYQLDLPMMLEFRIGEWSIASGLIMSKFIHSKGTGELLDGTMVTRHDIRDGLRLRIDEIIPKVLFGYEGIGKERRFRAMIGADVRRKGYGVPRRWVDVRFGASVRIGR